MFAIIGIEVVAAVVVFVKFLFMVMVVVAVTVALVEKFLEVVICPEMLLDVLDGDPLEVDLREVL